MVQEGEVALRSEVEDTLNNIPVSSTSPSPVFPPVNVVSGMPGTIESADTVAEIPEPVYGLLLEPPIPPEAAELRDNSSLGVSFIVGALFLLFLVISLRFRNNIKYAVTMFRNLMETRTRQNVFDDTVRETSLVVLLNILWCASAGILGYCCLQEASPSIWGWSHKAVGMLIGIGVSAVYALFMWGMYAAVGWVFSDRSHAELWVKGYSASQALMSPAFFLIALIALSRPELSEGAAIAAATVFVLVKLTFIWKGYRIFFTQFSSWVLFLCYLCSLEIVPLILCYRVALLLDKVL